MLIIDWNEFFLDCVAQSNLGPTVTARAMQIGHTAIFDAWAAFDDEAVGVHSRIEASDALTSAGNYDAALAEAISYAAYTAALQVFPTRTEAIREFMAGLGYDPDADTSDPELASEVAQLKPRLAVVGEMIDLAKPMARLTAQHVDSAQLAAQHVTPPSLLEPVTLERSIATAGKELGRADEDVRLLENVVDHAAANARQSAGIASEITDNARRRMAEQGRGQVPRQAAPAGGSPAR